MNSKEHQHTNRLIGETSLYLLQHAHNPVDWYAWKQEAFDKARNEDKPIILSIGYAACHWCHVMERESFEDAETAKFMNDHFICIKVDREERPDVDQIYMEAVQSLTGSGGWPLNVFLTPDKNPFYGGTYFPPKRAYNRASWMEVLESMREAFESRREEVDQQADKLLRYISQSDSTLLKASKKNEDSFDWKLNADQAQEKLVGILRNIFSNLEASFDSTNGGFGNAPKFPGSFNIQYLLRYGVFAKNDNALNHALNTLRMMIRGGIYDQAGGGFSRYSTDAHWLVPHFEKMLYDNALLITALSEAFQITHDREFENAIRQTIEFVTRELMNKEGAFFASLDADSEGEEGKFYVWSKKDLYDVLSEEAELFSNYYDVSANGNWEGKNILHRSTTDELFAAANQLSVEQLHQKVKNANRQLLNFRNKRVHPGLDDKIILSWNSLMVSALATAGNALNENAFRIQARKSLDFLLKNFRKSETDASLFHNITKGIAANHAILDDYASLIQACLDVYELVFEVEYLQEANRLSQYVIQHFLDEEDGMFFFTSDQQNDLIVRRKDFYDSVEPSGNAVMAMNLLRLGIIFNNPHYKAQSDRMVEQVADTVEKYPSSFANWAMQLFLRTYHVSEIAVVGKNWRDVISDIQLKFIPNKILMASENEEQEFELLKDRFKEGKTLIYVCRNYSCHKPVETIKEMQKQLNSNPGK